MTGGPDRELGDGDPGAGLRGRLWRVRAVPGRARVLGVGREVPDYQRLQEETVAATRTGAERVLELGTGTGETAQRVLTRHPAAVLVWSEPRATRGGFGTLNPVGEHGWAVVGAARGGP
jgi:hypothetical protein